MTNDKPQPSSPGIEGLRRVLLKLRAFTAFNRAAAQIIDDTRLGVSELMSRLEEIQQLREENVDLRAKVKAVETTLPVLSQSINKISDEATRRDLQALVAELRKAIESAD